MIDFPIVKIGELIKSGEAEIQTGPFGTQLKASDYSDHGYPVINVRNVGFGDIRTESLEFIDDRVAEKLPTHRLMQNDIVFGRKGAVERHGLITGAQEGWYQGSDCLRLRFNSSRVNPKFISYFFRTQAHQDWMMAVCAFGATMASLNQDIVKLINVPVPPIDIQNKIVGLLFAYDDLIENNKRRIALLENMAEEIYREWFVRFRFPGWQEEEFEKGLPVDWSIKKLSDILSLQYGKALKNEDRAEGSVPVYGSSGVVGFHNEALVERPGIIVGRKGNVGAIHWSDVAFYPIDTVYYVESDLSDHFLYYLLHSVNFINNDAAVPGLNRKQAYSNEVLVSKSGLIEQFEELVKPLYDQKKSLIKMNDNLEKTKNQLLPRLISGKLSVENLDIQLPPSMQSDQPDRADEAAA